VGLQVWRGAFLLADYLLANREQFKVNHRRFPLGSIWRERFLLAGDLLANREQFKVNNTGFLLA
jgi:hypothetical protein